MPHSNSNQKQCSNMRIKLFLYLLILIQISVSFVYGQDNKKTIRNTYVAPEITKLIESTPIKDQKGTLSCWSFATTSFIETEAIRLGKEPIILSPIFYILPHCCPEKNSQTWFINLNFNILQG